MADKSDIINEIRGHSVVIPDLERLLRDWPHRRSTYEGKLGQYVGEHLDGILGPGMRVEKMKAAQVETFIATWWPDANIEAMRLASELIIWLFIWDDDTDTPEYTRRFVDDMDAAQGFREETLAFLSQCLNRAHGHSVKPTSNKLINGFQPIAELVKSSFSEGQKQQLHRQLEIWITKTAIEQWHEVSGKLPDVDRYMQDRLGSSAVGVCLAICEYMLHIDLPEDVRSDQDMKCIWDCTNIIISIANDMLSFKKEIAQSRLDNLIILLYIQSGSLQFAMNGAFERVQEAKLELDRAAKRLAARYIANDQLQLSRDIHKFIDCCRTMCTGNNTWSLASERYLLGASTFNGGIEVHL